VSGRTVDIEVLLLHVLAMIALVAVQAEEAFFEDRVAAVPHSDRKANVLMAVADAGAADVKLSANDRLEIDQGLTSRAACERIERASDTAQKPDVSP
jgi:hypothetical protein